MRMSDSQLRPKQWEELEHNEFYADQRAHTKLLVSGLTLAHDSFVQAALSSLGYNIMALDCPDNDSLQMGKEYGNRGQCNPTYFTVGNLVKYLIHLRDDKGLSTEEIVRDYAFLTAGACGPCRFGMYITEYKKALRDSGFEGFRVLLFDAGSGISQASSREAGLELNKKFFITLVKAIFAGDVLNTMMYRIRPYELTPGETDEAIAECREAIMQNLKEGKSVLKALYQCRKILSRIKVDQTQAKPKVSVIGEFWAMTTEGEGNYRLQRFLEQEGAEVDVQPIVNWLLYNIWQAKVDTKRRMELKGLDDHARKGLKDSKIAKRMATLWFAEKAIKTVYMSFAKALGLKHLKLPDMNENAELAKDYYNHELRGGEGHMEVGKLIQTVKHKKAHMVISVKPFGCMPSSGVSDGVQSIVTEHFPEAVFLPIETSGDGAVNVYSRIQMMLFKAKQNAQKEYSDLLEEKSISVETIEKKIHQSRKYTSAVHYSKHQVPGTAANLVLEACA